MAWNSMDSAPQDRPVVMASSYGDVGCAVWWRKDWYWWADGAVIEYQSDFGTEYKVFECPVGWQERPAPPSK